MKRSKFLRDQTPWTFSIEAVHGCNLACGHCAMAVLDRTPKMMTLETWRQTMEIIARVNPECRVELAMGGEATLHPEIYEIFRVGREISPLSQFQITTNGTMLNKGVVTYRGLLDAGCNIVYTDMYTPREKFIAMAREADCDWYCYYAREGEPSKGRWNPWTYYGPEVQMIVLQENPLNWPATRRNANLLGTWLNHIDDKKAAKFGMKRVVTAPQRRCNQPFITACVTWAGDYLLCCQDMALETIGRGNVNEGIDGFLKFWFGKFMQEHRRWLREKDRAASPYCSRCSITFSRCDYKHWTDEQVAIWWDGAAWKTMPSEPCTGDADGYIDPSHEIETPIDRASPRAERRPAPSP